MNKKKYKMLLVILLAIVVINSGYIYNSIVHHDEQNGYNTTAIASNENGTVYKIVAGNMKSNETVGIILGVHPREHEIHEAINETLYNITSENGTNNLTKKYVVYYIKISENITSRDDTRNIGESLASENVVPNIKADDPFVVIDIHEIDSDYEYSNFIYKISNNSAKTNIYANEIADKLNITNYNFTEGTSPQKVTRPIAQQGINTLLFETKETNNYKVKENISNTLIYCLDNLKP